MTDEERSTLYKNTAKNFALEMLAKFEDAYVAMEPHYEIGVPRSRILIEMLKADGYKFSIEYLDKVGLLKEGVAK